MINTRVLLVLMALMAIGAFATVIAQTGTPDPPKLIDPVGALKSSCSIAVTLSDFTFNPGYAADGSLVSLQVNKVGIDPNLAWAEFNFEPGYKELGESHAWHAAVENLTKSEKGLGPKMLRAGDLWLTQKLGYAPLRHLWDTSGFNAFAQYLSCVEIIAKANALLDGTPMWSFVPIP